MLRTCPPPKAEVPRATVSQASLIVAICEARGIGQPMLQAILHGRYGCDGPAQLSMSQASRLIRNLMTFRRASRFSERRA